VAALQTYQTARPASDTRFAHVFQVFDAREFFQMRLYMDNIVWFFRLPIQRPFTGMVQRVAGGLGVAILLTMTGIASAQGPDAATQSPDTHMSVPQGYTINGSVDLGGRMSGLSGSGAMYDTMVNMQSGPRVLGETFQMHALPGTKHTLIDSLSVFGSGFGGDPYSFAKMDFYKGKVYEFSGMFRRDRQYFDYDLLGNPNIPSGQSIPIGPTGAPTGSLAWPQVEQSPFMFNTVRRMTDTDLSIFPLSKVTYHAGYSQNIFQGPSLTPSGYQFAGSYDVLLQEYQRNSTDDFTGGIDWKPIQGTKLTFEEEIDHYKADSYFTLAPSDFTVQEADGTNVALLANYDSLTPYSSNSCNASSMGTSPMLLGSANSGGLPVINAACAVATGYLRSQPTRILYPTETFRFQSSSIKNVSMNGDVRYTKANMSLPNYYDSFQGLGVASKTAGALRSQTYRATATADRDVIAANYGIIWQASKTVSLADQLNFSNVHQPGTSTMTSSTSLLTPMDSGASTGNETINNPTLITTTGAAGASTLEGSGAIGTPLPGYFGQRFLTNTMTVSWDATSRATLSLGYRYGTHTIAEGTVNPGDVPLAVGTTTGGIVTINENGGIFNAALRPTANWNLNGTVEIFYADNAFTPVGPRQTKHYRVHTLYRPKSWATVSGAFNDRERHNNTNNTGLTPLDGPIDHVDHSRAVSLGANLFPNEHYGLDFNYAYSDVYTATNICYDAAASATQPGAAPASGALCPGATVRGTNYYEFGPARDFMDAPTQSGSVALMLSPIKSLKSNIGYNISAVNGSRFYNDARDVAGSLVSTYQSPFVNLAWTLHRGLTWNAAYNFYGYGEGGPSGSPYCSASNPTLASPTVPVVSCSDPSLTGLQTGLTISPAGETAPRNFHANNVTLGVHYEF